MLDAAEHKQLKQHDNENGEYMITVASATLERDMHTHTNPHMQTSARTPTYPRTHIHLHTYTHTNLRIHAATHMPTYPGKHVRTRTHTYTHVHTRAHTCMRVHALTCTCTHARTKRNTATDDASAGGVCTVDPSLVSGLSCLNLVCPNPMPKPYV